MNYTKLLKQLELHEGWRKYPYHDTVGKLTIGIGRNLDDRGISREEALFMLENDIKEVVQFASHKPWFNSLSDVRKRVIVDMMFNLGTAGFMKFKRTIQAIEERDWDKASEQMLASKWARQVGSRAVRLAEMMRTDEDYE